MREIIVKIADDYEEMRTLKGFDRFLAERYLEFVRYEGRKEGRKEYHRESNESCLAKIYADDEKFEKYQEKLKIYRKNYSDKVKSQLKEVYEKLKEEGERKNDK